MFFFQKETANGEILLLENALIVISDTESTQLCYRIKKTLSFAKEKAREDFRYISLEISPTNAMRGREEGKDACSNFHGQRIILRGSRRIFVLDRHSELCYEPSGKFLVFPDWGDPATLSTFSPFMRNVAAEISRPHVDL